MAPGRQSVDVLVVGGGPCGLAAALGAAQRGRSVALVEASSQLGGMARSIDVAGQRVDLGSHRLHPAMPARVRALLDGLLDDDLQVRPRHGRLHLAGRWVAFPLRAGDVVRSVPPGVGARIGADLVAAPLRRRRSAGDDDSYADVVRAGLGPTALARFHGPMAAKLWGLDPAELSGELARRRIAVRTGAGLVRRIARGSRRGGATFLYPRRGYGQVVERLAAAAGEAGAGLRTGVAVERVVAGRSPCVRLSSGEDVRAGRVLWTAPPSALLAAVPGVPAVLPLAHRGVALVYLVVAEDRYSPVDAHYVPDADVAFARLSEPKNYRDGPDPEGRTVLCAEIPAEMGDAVWRAADDELTAMVLDGMAQCGLGRPPVVGVRVVRLPQVYPVIRRADRSRAAVLAAAEQIEGVTVLGRQGLHVADNVHHVLDMSLSAVGCLGEDGWDEEAWDVARRRFDTFVVDD